MTQTIEYQAFPRPFGRGGFTNPQIANGNTGNLSVEGYDNIGVTIDVTAVSGTATPTLTLNVQALDPTSGKQVTLPNGSISFTATGTVRLQFIDPGVKKIRLSWTITGTTPSFTFTVNYTLQV